MTVICTDGRTMAADSLQLCGEHLVVNRTRRKLFRMPDGSVVGMAGNAFMIELAKAWMLAGEDRDNLPAYPRNDPKKGFTGLRLYPGGRCERFNQLLAPIDTAVPTAIGAGEQFAVALLGAGLPPALAVKECKRWCVYVGGKVRTMKPKRKR